MVGLVVMISKAHVDPLSKKTNAFIKIIFMSDNTPQLSPKDANEYLNKLGLLRYLRV